MLQDGRAARRPQSLDPGTIASPLVLENFHTSIIHCAARKHSSRISQRVKLRQPVTACAPRSGRSHSAESDGVVVYDTEGTARRFRCAPQGGTRGYDHCFSFADYTYNILYPSSHSNLSLAASSSTAPSLFSLSSPSAVLACYHPRYAQSSVRGVRRTKRYATCGLVVLCGLSGRITLPARAPIVQCRRTRPDAAKCILCKKKGRECRTPVPSAPAEGSTSRRSSCDRCRRLRNRCERRPEGCVGCVSSGTMCELAVGTSRTVNTIPQANDTTKGREARSGTVALEKEAEPQALPPSGALAIDTASAADYNSDPGTACSSATSPKSWRNVIFEPSPWSTGGTAEK